VADPKLSFIGRSMPRAEDLRFLAGQATYVADVVLPDMAHVALVRSWMAHAVVLRIDTSRARSLPGVLDVFTAEDIQGWLGLLPTHRPLPPGREEHRQAVIAADRVRYVGEPLAVVVAESRHLAEDAAELILPELEPLQPISSVEQAVAAGSPRLFDGFDNEILSLSKSAGADPDVLLTEADVVVEATFRTNRHSSVPLETRGLVARPDPDGGMTVWGPTKIPDFARRAIAEMLALSPDLVRLVRVDVGGGFGVRGELYPEDFLVPLAALRLGRPVSWIEDRREHLVAANQSRETVWRVRAGLRRDGTLLVLDGDVTLDAGAYVRPALTLLVELAAVNFLGPYRVPAFRCRSRAVLTNKTGVGTVRAPARPEATFARERLLDRAARTLGLDPIDLRARNLLAAEDFPYDTGLDVLGTSMIYDACDPQEALRVAVEALGEDRGDLGSGAEVRVGSSVVPFIESTGLGPVETARLTVEPPGVVTVWTGTTSMGQGHETSLAQIAADAVGVAFDLVDVREGDPDSSPRTIGTFASRTAVMAGSAVWEAGRQLRELIGQLAPGGQPALDEILRIAAERGVSLDVVGDFRSDHHTYVYGAQAALVSVDPALGVLKVLKYIVVADVGLAVNPMIVIGQIAGGAVQGIGGAMLEELRYSDDGQPLSTSFMEYLLPSARDVPDVQVILLDRARTPHNPLGIKGAGEVGNVAVAAVLAGAAEDALGAAGPAIESLPLKPERLIASSRSRRMSDD
jgi:carbon-monoxide dehydrogenase large subunit